jgi:hypothetical protein
VRPRFGTHDRAPCEVALARNCGAVQGRATCLIFGTRTSDYAGFRATQFFKVSDSMRAKNKHWRGLQPSSTAGRSCPARWCKSTARIKPVEVEPEEGLMYCDMQNEIARQLTRRMCFPEPLSHRAAAPCAVVCAVPRRPAFRCTGRRQSRRSVFQPAAHGRGRSASDWSPAPRSPAAPPWSCWT